MLLERRSVLPMRLPLVLLLPAALSACVTRPLPPPKVVAVPLVPDVVMNEPVLTDASSTLTRFWLCLRSDGRPVLTDMALSCSPANALTPRSAAP